MRDDLPVRVMALHALAYCERLFYLEEVEEIRIADASVYAGRTLHEELRQAEEEKGEWTSLMLSSPTLGLTGKVDCFRRRDGGLIPYEHKRGRPRREDDIAQAWPSDAIQVSAYGMLLEEETGETVEEGRIRYHAENVTVRVPLDEAARAAVHDAVARAKTLRAQTSRPPVTENDRLCVRCSLAPVCLPEEERLLKHAEREPVRLFPADIERKTLHVVEPGARISRSGDRLKITIGKEDPRTFPIREIGSLVLHGYPQLTTQALHFCARNGIGVHWLSAGHRYVTSIAPSSGAVQRRLRQYHALSDPGLCLRLARLVVNAKITTALRFVLRATRERPEARKNAAEPIATFRRCLRDAAGSEGVDVLRGYEGLAGRAYFMCMDSLLHPDVSAPLHPQGRTRRPPQDRFNALLSYGYSLLYQAVMQAVLDVGLEPPLGFFHTPRSSAYPLVLDLMELFRVVVWDMPVIGSLNRHQWNKGDDFDATEGRVWLSEAGRRKAISLFERRLQETWKHPVIGYSLSYARLMELEVRLLEKEWTGAPGLFAKMRIR